MQAGKNGGIVFRRFSYLRHNFAIDYEKYTHIRGHVNEGRTANRACGPPAPAIFETIISGVDGNY